MKSWTHGGVAIHPINNTLKTGGKRKRYWRFVIGSEIFLRDDKEKCRQAINAKVQAKAA